MRVTMISTALAVLAGTLLAAGSAGAQQFDLQCEGTRQLGPDGPVEPHVYGFRIDLDARRWCWDHCERTYEIQEVAPDAIVFISERVDSPRQRSTTENRVDRTTGEHRLISIQTFPRPNLIETRGACRRAEFSGFPEALF